MLAMQLSRNALQKCMVYYSLVYFLIIDNIEIFWVHLFNENHYILRQQQINNRTGTEAEMQPRKYNLTKSSACDVMSSASARLQPISLFVCVCVRPGRWHWSGMSECSE